MIDPKQLQIEIIRPVLRHLRLWSENAELLMLGTACVESECGRWLVQKNGPARGIYQMEPKTEEDIWINYLAYRPDLQNRVSYWRGRWGNGTPDELVHNLAYATAMARVHYLRDPSPIPNDLKAQAEYWKRVYNTPSGSGSVDDYIQAWFRFVGAGVI